MPSLLAFFILAEMSNDALQNNPPAGDLHITTHTSDWLWAVFALMLMSLLVALVYSFTSLVEKGRGHGFIVKLPLIVLTVSSIAYFSMASDLGATPIAAEFHRSHSGHLTRQVWYVRYIQWVINGPLLLLGLLLAKNATVSNIVTTLFMAVVLVICGLVGALVTSQYKWGYFVMGVAALFYIWYSLFAHGSRESFGRRGDVNRGPAPATHAGYVRGAAFLSFLWMIYPICWALSDGGNVISPTGEMVFYGVLDILSGPVFLLIFLHGIRNAYDQATPRMEKEAERNAAAAERHEDTEAQ